MPTAEQIQRAIQEVTDQRSFIDKLLRQTLNWPIDLDFEDIGDITYEWPDEELNAVGLSRATLSGPVLQMQSLEQQHEQPWGIFILEFAHEAPLVTGRGLMGPLRKVLRGLVPARRRRANLPSWNRENLLFICTHQYRHFRFAYFKAPRNGNLAPLTTFGWGPDIPSRTACEFNLPALQWPEKPDKWVSTWQAAFDKEKLSKLFFDQYKALADILRSDLKKQSDNLNWAHDYTLQLLNRLMFLHFIQRRRWLGNDTDFFRSFWHEYRTSNQPDNTFFDKWLKVLFFEAFTNRFNYGHSHFSQKTREALAQAPYLNGGLFTENALDRMGDTYDIAISDDRIGQILAFFGKYNFTVSEDTPLDKDVAVDPEMIGMVYESLVNISEDEDRRGEAGIFYTPRVEIDMMCRLAIVDWLSNHLGTQHKELLYKWVFAYDEKDKNDATALVAAGKLTDPLKQLLSGISVLDPACGSGSFLVGMLYILDDLRERLERCDKISRLAYERRKEIIGSNLYGVDIKDWACHIAELRLWLTLIIDVDMTAAELHVRREPLLPNFSFNIRCGDSLVQEVGGVDMAHRGGSLELSHRIKLKLAELKREKARFYNNDPQRKCETASELEQMEVMVFRDLLEDRIKAADDKAKDLMRIQAQKEAYQQRNLLTGDLEGPAKQFTLEKEQREKEIAALMDEKSRLENALNGLRNKASAPFVWDIAFAEIFGGERNGFDIVIGNPPYVRQENIANPDPHIDRKQATQPEVKKQYKAKIARSVYKAFSWYFDYKEGTDKAARHPLDKKSDLYIYFYFKGLSLLNDRGTFCFITSNSWLDVGYGADLQEFLLRRSHVKMVMDNKAKRSFKSADVNTLIVLLAAPLDKKASDDASLGNTSRFVMFNIPFENAVSADTFIHIETAKKRVRRDSYSVFAASQQHLLEEGLEQQQGIDEEAAKPKKAKSPGIGIKIAKYIGNKWGGKYLRAPDIYWTIQERSKSKLIELGSVAKVKYGMHTGADDFFYLSKDQIKLGSKVCQYKCDGSIFDIDRKYLKPLFKSAQDSKQIMINEANSEWYVLLIPEEDAKVVKDTAVWKYLLFGKKQKIHEHASIKQRACWFVLEDYRPSHIIHPKGFNNNVKVFLSTEPIAVHCRLYSLFPYKKQCMFSLAAILNSTFHWLNVELTGRTSLGQGALDLMVFEMPYFQIPDPEKVDRKNIEIIFTKLANREIKSFEDELSMADRHQLDGILSDYLSLTKGEREAVYEAVVNLVEARLSKASSLDPKKVEKRLDAVDATTGIWLGSPSIVPDDDGE